MALSADRITKSKGPLRRRSYKVATNVVIYAGAKVCLNASRYAVPAANTAGLSDVVGIATAKVDSTGIADGVLRVVVEQGLHLLDVAAGVTQADVGANAYVIDDQTVSDAAACSNKVRVGEIVEYLDETQDKAWVDVGNPRPPRFFASAEQTGNGAAQNVAHGLGFVPTGVQISVTELPDAAAEAGFDVLEGAHDATNVVVTVTNTVKYKVVAWA